MPTPNSYKLKLFLLFAVAYTFLYVLPNFHPIWPVRTLPLTWIDQAVPFLPWTFSIYTSDYTIFLFVILLIQDKARFQAFARMMFATLFICGSFFIFYPTTYLRPDYPMRDGTFINFVMHLVRAADTPNNCFPSMHVALTCTAAWAIRHRGPKYFWFFSLWAFLIVVSTLTTKQHYLADILGGLTVTLTVCFLEYYFFESRNVPNRTNHIAI